MKALGQDYHVVPLLGWLDHLRLIKFKDRSARKNESDPSTPNASRDRQNCMDLLKPGTKLNLLDRTTIFNHILVGRIILGWTSSKRTSK